MSRSLFTALAVSGAQRDLTVENVSAPTALLSGQDLVVTWQVQASREGVMRVTRAFRSRTRDENARASRRSRWFRSP